MSIIGNPITLGGGKIDCCAVFFGRTTIYRSFPCSGIYGGYQWADGKFFEQVAEANSTFKCLKAGTYYFSYYLKGAYNSSGSFKQTIGRLSINGTTTYSITTDNTSGNHGIWSLNLSAGDVVFWDQRVNWSSSLNVNGAGMISLTQPTEH